MNKKLISGATLVAALFVAGCETGGGTASRIQEKSVIYNNLAPWQQRDIQDGVVSIGGSTDMVYMALGKPSKIVTSANGTETTWTYNNYYPQSSRSHAQATLNMTGSANNPTSITNANAPSRGAAKSDTSTRGSTQSSLDVPDMPSDTLYVIFREGQVYQTKLASEQ